MTEHPADLCSYGTGAGLRPRRMLDLLEGSTSHTFKGLEAVAMDRYILLAETYVPLLIQWEQSVGDQVVDRAAVQRGLAALAPWDLTASVDSRGAALFTRWALKVKSWKSLPYPAPPVVTPADQVGALSLLAEAVVGLETNQGRADVLYGDVHRIRRGTVSLPVGGSEGGLQALPQHHRGRRRRGLRLVRRLLPHAHRAWPRRRPGGVGEALGTERRPRLAPLRGSDRGLRPGPPQALLVRTARARGALY